MIFVIQEMLHFQAIGLRLTERIEEGLSRV